MCYNDYSKEKIMQNMQILNRKEATTMYVSDECPVCGGELGYSDYERFGMCSGCYADKLISETENNVVYEFLDSFRSDFADFLDDYYDC